MAPIRGSEDSISPASDMSISSTFEVTHLPARRFSATQDETEQEAPLKRGDWQNSQSSYWEQYKPVMRRLYIDEERPLREVSEIMEKDFGFRATYVFPLQLWHWLHQQRVQV